MTPGVIIKQVGINYASCGEESSNASNRCRGAAILHVPFCVWGRSLEYSEEILRPHTGGRRVSPATRSCPPYPHPPQEDLTLWSALDLFHICHVSLAHPAFVKFGPARNVLVQAIGSEGCRRL